MERIKKTNKTLRSDRVHGRQVRNVVFSFPPSSWRRSGVSSYRSAYKLLGSTEISARGRNHDRRPRGGDSRSRIRPPIRGRLQRRSRRHQYRAKTDMTRSQSRPKYADCGGENSNGIPEGEGRKEMVSISGKNNILTPSTTSSNFIYSSILSSSSVNKLFHSSRHRLIIVENICFTPLYIYRLSRTEFFLHALTRACCKH